MQDPSRGRKLQTCAFQATLDHEAVVLGVEDAHDVLYAPPANRAGQVVPLERLGTLVAGQAVAQPTVDQDGALGPH